MICVYDSMLSRGHVSVSEEINHLAVMLPSILESLDFQKKTERTDWMSLEAWKGKTHFDAFDVRYADGIVQQASGSLDCGMFVCAFVEFLSDQQKIPHSFLNADLHRTRYVALLWDYDVKKVHRGYASDNDDPKMPREPFDLPDDEELIDVSSV